MFDFCKERFQLRFFWMNIDAFRLTRVVNTEHNRAESYPPCTSGIGVSCEAIIRNRSQIVDQHDEKSDIKHSVKFSTSDILGLLPYGDPH